MNLYNFVVPTQVGMGVIVKMIEIDHFNRRTHLLIVHDICDINVAICALSYPNNLKILYKNADI